MYLLSEPARLFAQETIWNEQIVSGDGSTDIIIITC